MTGPSAYHLSERGRGVWVSRAGVDDRAGGPGDQARVMAIVDAINRIYGRNTLIFAIQDITRSCKMKQLKLSSHFTKKWSEVLPIT